MHIGEFTKEELKSSLKALKKQKCSGDDNIPAEFWQVCLDVGVGNEKQKNPQLQAWLLEFCNLVYRNVSIPASWHRAKVACLFKKGDPACPENYRPISLVQVGYKLFSSLILNRFKVAGVEDKLWKSQFGFRSGCGTQDAIFIARRLIEQCHNNQDQSRVFLALDWAKAFDSIDPKCLVQALRRYGIPPHYLDIIASIYSNRKFVVHDHGHDSQTHQQFFGISQGCPLSPFLFVMVMTVLLHDANDMLHQVHGINLRPGCCSELVYADDTLLIDVSTHNLQKYMECIATVGAEYGLKLNWGKVEQMNINCHDMHIHDPAGTPIKVKQHMRYLGAQMNADGHIESEVSQKIGTAAREFKCLKRIWNHCSIKQDFKFIVFTSCVIQRLLYSLESAWMNKNLLKKLDGFYAKCLRQILRISPSFISRVTNEFVLQQFNTHPLSTILLKRQLQLFGKVARMPNHNVVRESVFEHDSIDMKQSGNRRRGRPRNTWTNELRSGEVSLVPIMARRRGYKVAGCVFIAVSPRRGATVMHKSTRAQKNMYTN
jgi:hypothetical protein